MMPCRGKIVLVIPDLKNMPDFLNTLGSEHPEDDE